MRLRRSLKETGSKKQRKLHKDTSEKLQQKQVERKASQQ